MATIAPPGRAKRHVQKGDAEGAPERAAQFGRVISRLHQIRCRPRPCATCNAARRSGTKGFIANHRTERLRGRKPRATQAAGVSSNLQFSRLGFRAGQVRRQRMPVGVWKVEHHGESQVDSSPALGRISGVCLTFCPKTHPPGPGAAEAARARDILRPETGRSAALAGPLSPLDLAACALHPRPHAA